MNLELRIEALVIDGPESVTDTVDLALLVELARRWVAAESRRRNRPERHARGEREVLTASVKQKMKELAAAVAAEIRVEWTADLLNAKFQMPDGSAVTWGAASSIEHQAVAKHLESKATGDLKAAATHHRAVAEIQAAHASNLFGAQRAVA